jgi:TPP-dependent pyruvate/acetoin dehydrogenase alpha subunit
LVQGQSGGALNDPIAAMEVYLAQKGLWSEAWKQSLVNTFRKRLDAAIVAAQTEKETTTKGPKEPGRK